MVYKMFYTNACGRGLPVLRQGHVSGRPGSFVPVAFIFTLENVYYCPHIFSKIKKKLNNKKRQKALKIEPQIFLNNF